MSATPPEYGRGVTGLPPLASEDHVCDDCEVFYSAIGIDDAVGAIARLPHEVKEEISTTVPEVVRMRPGAGLWSIAE